MQENNTVKKNRTIVSTLFDGSLKSDIFIMLVLCFAGVFCKKLINPFANTVTDSLHVPGGISTAIALMFLVIASGITGRKWCASAMGLAQVVMALALGSMGSMGLLMPLAYLIPGVVIDLVMLVPENRIISLMGKSFIANIASSVSAALFADIVVFHLPVKPLVVYLCLATVSGAICGFIAGAVSSSINKKKNEENEGDGKDE